VSDTCANCGGPTEWSDCWECGGDGFFDVYEEDPLWYAPGETEACRTCEGKGGWRDCVEEPAWCEAHPIKPTEAA
jgi:hypothetical protein